jgi:hypothetical protein
MVAISFAGRLPKPQPLNVPYLVSVESVHLQLRLKAENEPDQVNFQGPITDETTTLGLFVAATPPQIVQVGAKRSFYNLTRGQLDVPRSFGKLIETERAAA